MRTTCPPPASNAVAPRATASLGPTVTICTSRVSNANGTPATGSPPVSSTASRCTVRIEETSRSLADEQAINPSPLSGREHVSQARTRVPASPSWPRALLAVDKHPAGESEVQAVKRRAPALASEASVTHSSPSKSQTKLENSHRKERVRVAMGAAPCRSCGGREYFPRCHSLVSCCSGV